MFSKTIVATLLILVVVGIAGAQDMPPAAPLKAGWKVLHILVGEGLTHEVAVYFRSNVEVEDTYSEVIGVHVRCTHSAGIEFFLFATASRYRDDELQVQFETSTKEIVEDRFAPPSWSSDDDNFYAVSPAFQEAVTTQDLLRIAVRDNYDDEWQQASVPVAHLDKLLEFYTGCKEGTEQ